MELITREQYAEDAKLSKAYMEKGIDVNFGLTPIDVIDAAFDRLAVTKNSFVVDIGCGDGRALKLARARGARVLGVECSKLRYRLAQKQLAEFLTDVTLIHGDYRDVAIPREVTHLFSFLWPNVTEDVIKHVQQTVVKFKGVSVCHKLDNASQVKVKSKLTQTNWHVFYYSSIVRRTAAIYPA